MTALTPLNRFGQSFDRYEAEIIRLLRRMGKVLEAKDATSLNGKTLETLLNSGRGPLAVHKAVNNPHRETAESIGSMSSSDIQAVLARKIPNGVLPLSLYGIADELSDEEVDAAWSISGSRVQCNRVMTVAMSGTVYSLPGQVLDAAPLSAVTGMLYLYVKLKMGAVRYLLSAIELPENASTMLIGSVEYNGTVLLSKQVMSVIRLGTYRLSHLPVGSAIPVTEGSYSAPVLLSPEWKPV